MGLDGRVLDINYQLAITTIEFKSDLLSNIIATVVIALRGCIISIYVLCAIDAVGFVMSIIIYIYKILPYIQK